MEPVVAIRGVSKRFGSLAALEAVDRHVPTLVEDRVASRLAQKDHTLWGPAAEEEASQRLGWMDLIEGVPAPGAVAGPARA